jgi:tripeptidyl-peptidase-1
LLLATSLNMMLGSLVNAVRKLLFLILAARAIVCPPVRVRSEYSVKDSHPVPDRWLRIGRAPPDHEIHLQICLKQGRFNELERHLYDSELHHSSI